MAFDPNIPHPHPPSLTPFVEEPKPVALSYDQEKKLRAGEVLLLTVREPASKQGRGVAVQYIEAPEDLVWDMILAYDLYPQRVNNVIEGSVYEKSGSRLYVALISKVLWVEFGIYTINELHRDKRYMSWKLDRRRTSDAEDLIGYWRITQIQDQPPVTRVDFASQLTLGGIPQFLEDYLREDSLRNGTSWVKRYAEEVYQKNREIMDQ